MYLPRLVGTCKRYLSLPTTSHNNYRYLFTTSKSIKKSENIFVYTAFSDIIDRKKYYVYWPCLYICKQHDSIMCVCMRSARKIISNFFFVIRKVFNLTDADTHCAKK